MQKSIDVFHIFSGDREVSREAALAADLITARKSGRGGCASSRLFHGCLHCVNPYRKGKQIIFILHFFTLVSHFFHFFCLRYLLEFSSFFAGPGLGLGDRARACAWGLRRRMSSFVNNFVEDFDYFLAAGAA